MKSVLGKLGVIIVVFIVAGCTTSQTKVPVMPKYDVQEERACARSCQAIYAQCNNGCGQMTGDRQTANQRRQCLDNCNQILKDCYSSCKQAPQLIEKKGI